MDRHSYENNSKNNDGIDGTAAMHTRSDFINSLLEDVNRNRDSSRKKRKSRGADNNYKSGANSKTSIRVQNGKSGQNYNNSAGAGKTLSVSLPIVPTLNYGGEEDDDYGDYADAAENYGQLDEEGLYVLMLS